jgi:hypothetical protein
VTREEQSELKLRITLLAEYYGQNISDEVVRMYAEDLSDLPFDGVVAAYQSLRRDPKVRRMPLPAEVRARLEPPETPEECARLAAAEVWEAIGRHGWANPDRALASLGGLAKQVVERSGGWHAVCVSSSSMAAGTFKAQLRDLAEAVYKRAGAGKLEQRVELPSQTVLPLIEMQGMPK